MKLEPVLTCGFVCARVGIGSAKPSPVPMVSLGLHVTLGGEGHVIVIEMTREESGALVQALLNAAAAGRDPAPTSPEGK